MASTSPDSIPFEGIATDAAHSQKHGITRYRAVDLKTGEEIFSENLGNQTVNIGEFLAVVHAVRYIIENNYEPPIIYTDSMTAINWFAMKNTASKKKYPGLYKAVIFLKAFASELDRIKVIHWDNRAWGETPADYGNK